MHLSTLNLHGLGASRTCRVVRRRPHMISCLHDAAYRGSRPAHLLHTWDRPPRYSPYSSWVLLTRTRRRQHNVVVQWNHAVLQGIRDTKAGPPMAARALAIVHTCIYE